MIIMRLYAKVFAIPILIGIASANRDLMLSE